MVSDLFLTRFLWHPEIPRVFSLVITSVRAHLCVCHTAMGWVCITATDSKDSSTIVWKARRKGRMWRYAFPLWTQAVTWANVCLTSVEPTYGCYCQTQGVEDIPTGTGASDISIFNLSSLTLCLSIRNLLWEKYKTDRYLVRSAEFFHHVMY